MRNAPPLRAGLRRLTIDGAVMGALFTAIAVGSLWIDRRIWIEDYPPDIQAAVGPDVAGPLGWRIATAAALLGLLFVGMAWSNRRLARDLGVPLRFRPVFVHSFALFWLVNVVDIVVVDWLIFVALQPDFVVFPGTEGLAGYRDYVFHLRESVLTWQPWLASVVFAGLVALVLPRVSVSRRRG